MKAKKLSLLILIIHIFSFINGNAQIIPQQKDVAYIQGNVTDANTGDPLAEVYVINETDTTQTSANGYYLMETSSGVYDVLFQKFGYQDYIEEGVVTIPNDTIIVNAQLWEELYALGWVIATKNDDDTECLIEWTFYDPEYEIFYDDGEADDYFCWMIVGNANAVKFTPAGYPATVIGGKIYVGDGSFPAGGNFIGTTFGAAVYDDTGEDGLPGTQLDSIEVTVDNYGWVDFTGLSATIEDGDFFIAMFQGGVPPNTAPLGVDYTIPTVYRSYSYNAEFDVWALSAYQDFMIRAIVYGPQSDDGMAESTEIVYLTKPVKQDFLSLHAPNGLPGTVKSGEFIPITDGAATNRDVVSYTVAR
ncbi:MAG: carboxypeptidase-like regulatory domain-containing protein, partial [Bacteroidales bacterium]|nr:carboxypeptidase-like regulatory domain-containing protein [Bacteroidales bacterium]